MSSMLTSSQALTLATTMDVYLEKHSPSFQILGNQDSSQGKPVLKSHLASSGDKKRVKDKKRVTFAEDVKDSKGNSEVHRKQHRKCGEILPVQVGMTLLDAFILEDMKNTKRVMFAEDVKDSKGNSEVHRKQHRKCDDPLVHAGMRLFDAFKLEDRN